MSSCKQIITNVENEHGIIWGELPVWQKRGEFWMKGKGIINAPRFNEVRESLDKMLMETFND
jgi:hypothetical protein